MNSNWLPSNIGAEPKKLAMLAGVLALLGVVWWTNQSPEPAAPPLAAQPPAVATKAAQVPPRPIPSPTVQVERRRVVGKSGPAQQTIADFRPTLKLPEGTDVSNIDPSLRLELLAKADSREVAGGARSLFEFSAAPVAAVAKVDPIKPTTPQPAKPVEEVKPLATPANPVDPPKPPPPPIPLKYYGFAGMPQNGQRRAFFLDGEDIFVAGENELVRGRYRIVRIGVNSAVVEDMQNKNQQTLPLVEELGNA